MEIVITAVGPDHEGLADPIIHYVTQIGANISEIQMFDHREEAFFAMLLRMNYTVAESTPGFLDLRKHLSEIGELKGLSVRVWSPEERKTRPNLALCVTYRPEPVTAILDGLSSF